VSIAETDEAAMESESQKAYLLTWNPKTWPWENLDEAVKKIDECSRFEDFWSSGPNKSIKPASRVFLLRQGLEPRGIVGSGIALSEPYPDEHWDNERARRGEKGRYVKLAFDTLLNPEMGDEPLALSDLKRGELGRVHWNTQSSGIQIKYGVDELERLWADHLRRVRPFQVADGDGALEGALRLALTRHRTRESWLRDAKIREAKSLSDGKLSCEVLGCGFDFLEVYGEIGRDFAQVHHRKPLSDRTRPIKTSLSDLAIVCANCHAMIHRGEECRPIETLLFTNGLTRRPRRANSDCP
jgi:5-methylcytosine-specific restriction enzyme A